MQAHTHPQKTALPSPTKLRNALDWPVRNWTPDCEEKTETLLEQGFGVFCSACELPVPAATEAAFRRIYRPSAERAIDSRVWRLVGKQLLGWLDHAGQLATRSAQERGKEEIRVADFEEAVRRIHGISASPFCPIPDDPGGEWSL